MIGWYVHHHGWGHLTRMQAVRPHLREQVTVFSSLPAPRILPADTVWVALPSDADPVLGEDGIRRDASDRGDVTAGGALHWAPVGHPGHRSRLALMAEWIAAHPVSAFVVDVSVEVTALARLMGAPTVVFAQPGDRIDAPHRLGYDLADGIVAPWPRGAFDARGLAGRGDRVREVGGVSRFDGRPREDAAPSAPPSARRVLFLGRTLDPVGLRRCTALLETDGWIVATAGARGDDRVADVWPLLCRADVVVSAAGQNAVADLAAADARAVVIGQDRPFGEQADTVRVLAALGLAQTAPPDASPEDIARLVRRAHDSPTRWSQWGVDGAAARAADAIEERIA